MTDEESRQLDAFAAAAMAGLLNGPFDDAQVARRAFSLAAAMMAERQAIHAAAKAAARAAAAAAKPPPVKPRGSKVLEPAAKQALLGPLPAFRPPERPTPAAGPNSGGSGPLPKPRPSRS